MKIFKGISVVLCVILITPYWVYSAESYFFTQYINTTFFLDESSDETADNKPENRVTANMNDIDTVSDENLDQAYQALQQASLLDDPLMKALFIGLAVVAVIIALQSMQAGN